LGETIGKQSKVQCSSVTPSLQKQTEWNRHKNMQVKTSSCQSMKKAESTERGKRQKERQVRFRPIVNLFLYQNIYSYIKGATSGNGVKGEMSVRVDLTAGKSWEWLPAYCRK